MNQISLHGQAYVQLTITQGLRGLGAKRLAKRAIAFEPCHNGLLVCPCLRHGSPTLRRTGYFLGNPTVWASVILAVSGSFSAAARAGLSDGMRTTVTRPSEAQNR